MTDGPQCPVDIWGAISWQCQACGRGRPARCRHCGHVITRYTRGGRPVRSPTGWTHDWHDGWAGARCPGKVTGAQPAGGPGVPSTALKDTPAAGDSPPGGRFPDREN
jgi:hypothetical protein